MKNHVYFCKEPLMCGAIEDELIKDTTEITILGITPVKHHYQLWLSPNGSGNSLALRGPSLGGQR